MSRDGRGGGLREVHEPWGSSAGLCLKRQLPPELGQAEVKSLAVEKGGLSCLLVGKRYLLD